MTHSFPAIIAHRGASHDAPENTCVAFRLAWERSADGIEGDVRLTRDGHMVLMHDATAERTAGRPLSIKDATLPEVMGLDAGYWKGNAYKGEQVPILADVLDLVPSSKQFYLEVKCGVEIMDPLCAALEKSDGASSRITMISFHEDVLLAARERLPGLKTYLLVSVREGKVEQNCGPLLSDVVSRGQRLALSGIGVNVGTHVDEGFVQQCGDADLDVNIWTVDDVDWGKRLVEWGVTSITTNRPGWLRQQLSAACRESVD